MGRGVRNWNYTCRETNQQTCNYMWEEHGSVSTIPITTNKSQDRHEERQVFQIYFKITYLLCPIILKGFEMFFLTRHCGVFDPISTHHLIRWRIFGVASFTFMQLLLKLMNHLGQNWSKELPPEKKHRNPAWGANVNALLTEFLNEDANEG